MSDGNGSSKAWEDWQLSALVLGELDEPLASEIKAAARQDPELRAELSDIKEALRQVRRVFKQEQAGVTAGGRSGQRLEKILAQAAGGEPAVDSDADAAGFSGRVANESGKTRGRLQSETDEASIASRRYRARLRWLGLAAMAASLLLAVWLVIPGATKWFLNTAMLSQKPTVGPDEMSPEPWMSVISIEGERNELQEELEMSPFGDLSEAQNATSGADSWAGSAVASGPEGVGSPAPKPDGDNRLSMGGGLGSSDGMGMGMGGYGGSARGVQSRTESVLGGAGYGGGEEAMGMRMGGSYGGEAGGYGSGGGYGGEGGYGGGGGYAQDGETDMGMAGGGYGGMGGGGMGGMGAASGLDSGRGRSAGGYGGDTLGYGMGGYGGYGYAYRANGDQFSPIYENRFQKVKEQPLSTFSIDVDTASYAKSRQLLLEHRRLPPADAVRIEEFVNYFDYEYNGPQGEDPFGANLAIADCPWRPEHKLVRIALQAEKLDMRDRPKANIVFLLDVSGSMDEPNKLPLVKDSMRMLSEQLGENDRVAMVVYAGAAGCVLEGTRGDQQQQILGAIDRLNAGGSTNGGQGIQLAYDLARDNFVPGGINRVILCTDGDFNVGVTSTEALVNLVEENAKSKIFLTVLGFGMGNTNDAMMEQISNRGNGVYGFIDNRREAHRQMVQQLAANLVTVAKDVKIQVEFNPNRVQSYRLLGYENRVMAAKDFNDDTKDAGEIGAGHRVTAFYEIVPTGVSYPTGDGHVDELRYRPAPTVAVDDQPEIDGPLSQEWLAVKLRYKQPEGDTSKKLVFPLDAQTVAFDQADRDFRWAASIVEFGMLLRHSRYRGQSNWRQLLEQATSAAGVNPSADRQESLEMIRTASALVGQP